MLLTNYVESSLVSKKKRKYIYIYYPFYLNIVHLLTKIFGKQINKDC